MTAIAEQITITSEDEAEAIARCRAVLARARERAWQAGPSVVYAMAALQRKLRAAENRAYVRSELAEQQPATAALIEHAAGGQDPGVTCAEAARRHLIAVIARDYSQDEAEYVAEGDEQQWR